MNYDDHLSRFEARQKALALQAEQERQHKLIALDQAIKEADQIITDFILPELETLRIALLNHNFPARITTTREVSELSPYSTFDIEIALREAIPPENVRLGITFSAVPHGKFFTVTTVSSCDRQQKPACSEVKFSEVTAGVVQSVCANFMTKAFPVPFQI